ncbi:DUF948 domain-containing protein [Abyssicoccus albus]|uniref:Uncharacterized protein YoxC n=1 Tax=Abyssicoccus albus TaxID=1817405 RepID=A0A3N5BIM9_9BACL|nr:uncharacterized protein YoxC [Abyssicoccus albus]
MWEIMLYAAALIAAIALLIICIVGAVVLLSVKKNLDHVANTLDGVQGQIQGITRESTDLLHKTNRLVEDVQGKSQKVNSVFDAVNGLGYSVQNLNHSVDRVTNSVTHNVSKNEDQISQVVQWSNVAMEIADKWQNRRNRNNHMNQFKSNNNQTKNDTAVNPEYTTVDDVNDVNSPDIDRIHKEINDKEK